MIMRYASVCAGIEAASVAWEPLGWRPVLFSEIEAFPRAVLKHRQRAVEAGLKGAARLGVPLWGDFTAIRPRHLRRLGIEFPDLLVGGTPCQAFSVAGLRRSLEDDRGNLTLAYVRLIHATDPRWAVWENVPGVLSTDDNAFGCFLAGLVGADAALAPPGGGAMA
ncbi:MAG: DNA cytosine methyltransferase [Pseudomonadota bacterium]